ncbi:MAG: YciI family protein [Nocardioides sp.]
MTDTSSEDVRKYVVFVVENEPDWEAKTDAERQVTFDADYAFGQALEKRGGRVIGGSALGHTSRWQILSNDAGVTRRTDGPYAESVEQLGGFYIVESPSMEAIVESAEVMMPVHVRLEIAPGFDA